MRSDRTLMVMAALMAAACTDRAPTGVTTPSEARLAALDCAVDVRAGTLACAPAPAAGGSAAPNARTIGGPRLDLTVGGQNTYIRIATAGAQTRDEATDLLSGPVTVTNLMAQPLGTPDGSTVTGVKVFFHQQPVVTQGTGTVDVANPDGFGTFTGSNQPYHLYNQVIQPGATSAPETWQFRVPPTVVEFRFQVYVRAATPAEQGVLRWAKPWEPGGYETFGPVRGNSANGALAIVSKPEGTIREIQRFDGAAWRTVYSGTRAIADLWVNSPTDAYAIIGATNLLHSTDGGSSWQEITNLPRTPNSSGQLFSLWGSGPGDVYAVGEFGTILHYDGAAWALVANPAHGFQQSDLVGVYGTSSSDVYVVGSLKNSATAPVDPVVMHNDGTGFRIVPNPDVDAPGVFSFSGVWAAAPNDVYVYRDESVLRYDGAGNWTRPAALQGLRFPRVWGSSRQDVYVSHAGGNALHSTDGGMTWAPIAQPGTIYGTSASDLYATGSVGALAHSTNGGATWQLPPVTTMTLQDLRGAWASSPTNVVAVGAAGAIVRFDGTRWRHERDPSFTANPEPELYGVWGSASGDTIWAVGGVACAGCSAGAMRYLNGVWSHQPMPGPSANARPPQTTYKGIWGTSGSDMWAVGTAGAIAHYRPALGWELDNFSQTSFSISYEAIWGTSASEIVIVGGTPIGTPFIVRRNGTSWANVQNLPSVGSKVLHGVWASASNNYFAVGDGGLIWRSTDVGVTWSPMTSPTAANLRTVWGTSATDVYAAGDNGTLLHYDGATWSVVNNPLTGSGVTLFHGFAASAAESFVVGSGGNVLRGVR